MSEWYHLASSGCGKEEQIGQHVTLALTYNRQAQVQLPDYFTRFLDGKSLSMYWRKDEMRGYEGPGLQLSVTFKPAKHDLHTRAAKSAFKDMLEERADSLHLDIVHQVHNFRINGSMGTVCAFIDALHGKSTRAEFMQKVSEKTLGLRSKQEGPLDVRTRTP